MSSVLDTKGGEFPIPKILTLPLVPPPPNTLTHTQAESRLSKAGSQDTAEKSIKEDEGAASLEILLIFQSNPMALSSQARNHRVENESQLQTHS